ncbi:MAG: ferredoxin [Pirellulaceae bacterium]|nr:ferredoxin [Pirellulaceae bacterium]
MRRMNFVALLLLAGTSGSLHAQSLRGGGCSDLYGAGTVSAASTEVATASEPKTHLVSTNNSDSEVYVGLFRKGGCSHGGCLSHFGHHRHVQSAAPLIYSQAPVANYYQVPDVNYYQAPVAAPSYYSAPAVAAPAPAGCTSCGNAVITYGNTIQGNVSSGAVMVQTEQRSLMDCGPVNSYKVVLEPKYFTETRAVCTTEYQNETRYRTRVVARTVPVESQDYKTITVMVPRSETKTVEYTVLVPKTSEKTVEVVDTVPVWTEVAEQYTVKVPQVVEVPEEYKVRVAQLVDQEFTYTVQVPQAMTETRMQAVTNAVPVTKTRTVQTCQPVTRMQSVTKDYGHWEDRVEEVTVAAPQVATACATPTYSAAYDSPAAYTAPSYSAPVGNCGAGSCGAGHCGGHGCRLFRRGGCGSGCGHVGHGGCGSGASCGVAGGFAAGGCGVGQVVYAQPAVQTYSEPVQYSAPVTQTVTRRVWVPNVVTEEVPVVENVSQSQEIAYTVFEQHTEQIPYECTYIVYRPETRTGTRKVVNYVEETRTRSRKVVQYNDETRTRTLKKLSYKQETRTETIPVVSYATEKRTKEVSYTFNVPETKVEPFTSTRFETVNEEISEEYTVSVPVTTTKEVQVQVCRMVPKLVPITIYPCAEGQPVGGCANGCGSPTLAPAVPSAGCSGCASGCADCR